MNAFLELFSGLPRLAPGSDASSRKALGLAGDLPPQPRILDLGCGTGRSSILLAEETGGSVVAVDLHPPFLSELEAAAAKAGLSDRIQTRCAPMEEFPSRARFL